MKDEILKTEEKNKQKKIQPEDAVLEKCKEKYAEVASKRNALYYISMFVMNIAVLILAMFYINYKKGVDSFEAFSNLFDWGVFVLMISIFILVKMIEAVTTFVRLNQKTRYKNFGEVYKANAVGDYYGKMSVFGSGKTMTTIGYLENNKIKTNGLVGIGYERRYFSLVATLVLSVVMLIVGAFAWKKMMPTWLTIICFFATIVGFMYLLYIYMSQNDKQRSVNICSFFANLMGKLKFTKNTEKTYYEYVDKTMVVTKSRKIKPLYKVIDMSSSVATILLRGLILYLIFEMVGLGGAEYYFKALLILLTLDITKYILPIPNGAIVIDVIMISIFGNIMLPEYVWMSLLLYRVMDTILVDIHYIIVVIIDKIFIKNDRQDKITK